MPSTHACLRVHIVFSTKERRNFIEPRWRNELHAYIGGIIKSCGAVPLAIGGPGDHVHILASLKTTHSVSDLVQQFKGGSSRWVHETMNLPIFEWQVGFGVFSVSASLVYAVQKYVLNQEEHHRTKTFQEEYRELLIKHGIEFKEEYLW